VIHGDVICKGFDGNVSKYAGLSGTGIVYNKFSL